MIRFVQQRICLKVLMLFLLWRVICIPTLCAQSHAARIAIRITNGVTEDKKKVETITLWIAQHLKYDVKRYLKASTKRYSSRKVLRKRKALCDEYAGVFNEMCEAVGVKAVLVEGYTKDLFYDVNDPFYRVNHAWNAVQIEGKWFLLDVTFTSGGLVFKPKRIRNFLRRMIRRPPLPHKIKFKRSYTDTYFLNTPDKFMFDHFPADPVWQLGSVKLLEQIESDSGYYEKRDQPDVKNLHDERGSDCRTCDAIANHTTYQHKLYMGVVTPNYNIKQEEFAIEAHQARGDSLLRVVKEHTKQRIYNQEDADSCKMVIAYYKEALYDLKCHGKNIRNEYKYKIDKERKKLADCKKNKDEVRRNFNKEKVTMVNWREYSKQRYNRLKKNRVEEKFRLNLPRNIPVSRSHPKMDKAKTAFTLQYELVEKLNVQCERELMALRQLRTSILAADSVGFNIIAGEAELCVLRQCYYDDLKKVLVDQQKGTNKSIIVQSQFFNDISKQIATYKKAVKSADSLRTAIKNVLKSNYILAANIDHVSSAQFDSLTALVKNDFERCLDLMTNTDLVAGQLLMDTKEGTQRLIRKMKKETSYLNYEVGIEQSRAKIVIKHYVRDRNARYRINVKIQSNLYDKITESRRMNKLIELELRKLKQNHSSLKFSTH